MRSIASYCILTSDTWEFKFATLKQVSMERTSFSLLLMFIYLMHRRCIRYINIFTGSAGSRHKVRKESTTSVKMRSGWPLFQTKFLAERAQRLISTLCTEMPSSGAISLQNMPWLSPKRPAAPAAKPAPPVPTRPHLGAPALVELPENVIFANRTPRQGHIRSPGLEIE